MEHDDSVLGYVLDTIETDVGVSTTETTGAMD